MSVFQGLTIGILGAAATGLAAAPVLARRGARVRVFDARPAEQLGEAPGRLAPYAALYLGREDPELLEGCDLLIPSPGVPASSGFLQAALRRGIPVLSEIEAAYRIMTARLIAVTGTNGKTTTVFMTAAALQAAGYQTRVAGNTLARGYQTPLIQTADEASPDEWIVAEVSSFQLEWVEQFRPNIAVITNITSDHLNRHGTVAAYAAAKARLFAAQTAADWSVLNRDDPVSAGLRDRTRGRLLQIGRARHEAEGGWIQPGSEGKPELWLRLRGQESVAWSGARLQVPGQHNLENALAACCCAAAAGADLARAATGLARFPGVPDRLESLGTWNGIEFVNNTMCTNVDAAIRSLEAYERPVILIAGGRNKGLDFAPLGAVIAQRVKLLVSIGDDGPEIEQAARRYGFQAIRRAESMAAAVREAASGAAAGDVVLLAPACASFDWFRSFEERGAVFRAEVERLRAGGETHRGSCA
ncbi:MAG: UDP-N-acetylmuramoyl-L-alanine--D-glutamate ligase [Armatimonadetes bacterium]|nr:UDP-N-acetylmuramoyl-L-alanine--D-glutamate ligase [Armatimonadota bacterium]